MNITRIAGACALALLLAACGGPRIADYAAQGPALDLFGYFAGTTAATAWCRTARAR